MNSVLPALMEASVNQSMQFSVLIELLIEKNLITKEEMISRLEIKQKLFQDKAQEMKSKPSLIVPGQQ